MNYKNEVLTLVIILYSFAYCPDKLLAQSNFNIKPKLTTVMIPAQAKNAEAKLKTFNNPSLKKAELEIDSLNNVIIQYKTAYDNEILMIAKKDSLIEELDQKMGKIQNVNDDLARKLSNYKGDNLKLEQSNRILIIFNSIVGVLLLSTLIWFLRNIGRKKYTEKNATLSPYEITTTNELKPASALKSDHQYFENKLDQLEKLGKLKEKGILNEEEFIIQKQQLLGNSG